MFSKFYTQTLPPYISSSRHFQEKIMMDSWPVWKIEQDRALFRTIWLRFENLRFWFVHACCCFYVRKKKTHDAPSNLQIVFWALDLYIKTRPLILSFEHERWIVFETDLAYWNWRSTVNSISFEAQDYCSFGFESWPSDWSGRTRSEVCNRTPLLHTTLEYFWADFRFFLLTGRGLGFLAQIYYLHHSLYFLHPRLN